MKKFVDTDEAVLAAALHERFIRTDGAEGFPRWDTKQGWYWVGEDGAFGPFATEAEAAPTPAYRVA